MRGRTSEGTQFSLSSGSDQRKCFIAKGKHQNSDQFSPLKALFHHQNARAAGFFPSPQPLWLHRAAVCQYIHHQRHRRHHPDREKSPADGPALLLREPISQQQRHPGAEHSPRRRHHGDDRHGYCRFAHKSLLRSSLHPRGNPRLLQYDRIPAQIPDLPSQMYEAPPGQGRTSSAYRLSMKTAVLEDGLSNHTQRLTC